jgi:hypothetical protein
MARSSGFDVCQRSLAAIAADGFGARMLPGTLRRLVESATPRPDIRRRWRLQRGP